jgi:hypothetical protein
MKMPFFIVKTLLIVTFLYSKRSLEIILFKTHLFIVTFTEFPEQVTFDFLCWPHLKYIYPKIFKIVKESLQKGSVLKLECQQEVVTEVFQEF